MKNTKDVRIREQLKSKIKRGDFITLGKILGIEQNTARMQFNRGIDLAVKVMSEIIDNRENFVADYELRQNSVIIDCAIIGNLTFLVVIQYEGHVSYNLYTTVELLNFRVSEFISDVLKDVPSTIKLAVTDCSIGFLPKVIDTLQKFGFKQAFKHHSSANVEAMVLKITSKK